MPKEKIVCLPESELPPVEEDFRKTFSWRIFRIMAEFVEGFQFVAGFKKAAGIFGSTRAKESDHYYQEARKLASLLVKEDYVIVTGGGPGIMEAANLGAFEAGGESVGINIQLDGIQRTNEYVKNAIGLHYFFTRKVLFSYSCHTYVFFPGGFGTLDEFFELVTLVQTKKLAYPVLLVAVGKEFWQPMFDWVKKEIYEKHKAVSKEEIDIIHLVDSAEEVVSLIKELGPK